MAQKEDERREMEKDMKKLMKAHEKLKAKLAALQGGLPKDAGMLHVDKSVNHLITCSSYYNGTETQRPGVF